MSIRNGAHIADLSQSHITPKEASHPMTRKRAGKNQTAKVQTQSHTKQQRPQHQPQEGTVQSPGSTQGRSAEQSAYEASQADSSPCLHFILQWSVVERIRTKPRAKRIEEFLRNHEEALETFFEPIMVGFVVTLLILCIEHWHGGDVSTSDFVLSLLLKVKPYVVSTGLMIAALCACLTGWPPIRCLAKMIAIPVLSFSHHVMLVAAGALPLLLSDASAGESMWPVWMVLSALFILLVGGAELQAAIYFLGKPEPRPGKDRAFRILIGILGLIALLYVTLK